MAEEARVGWWQRLGGPNAISLPAWLLTLPGAILSAPTLGGEPTAVQALQWCVLGGIAHVLSGFVLILGRITVLPRRPRPSRPWAFVLIVVLAGMLRGLFLAFATVRLGLTDDLNLAARMAAASWALLLWMSLATLIVDGTRRHRATMASLRTALEREQRLVEESAARLRDYRAGIVRELAETVTVHLQGAVALAADPRLAGERLQEVVRDVVRPLSHELESRTIADDQLVDEVGEAPEKGPLPLRDYAEAAAINRPFSPALVTALVVGTSALLVLVSLGPVAGVICLALDALVVYTTTSAAREVFARRPASGSVPGRMVRILITYVVIAGSSGLAVLAVVLVVDPQHSLAPTATVAVLAMAAFVALGAQLAAAAVAAVSARRQQAEQDLREATGAAEWARARLRQQAFLEQRDMGRVLHGEVQARMVSAALQLQLNPPDDPESAITELDQRIQRALGERHSDAWRDDLAELEDVWSHAIALTVTVDDGAGARLDEDSIAAQAVMAVIQEAVTNAVRHGSADDVVATIQEDVAGMEDAVVIRVHDDGDTPTESTGKGLGARTFDGVCLEWSLDIADGGRFTARVATRRAANVEGEVT